MRFGLLSSVFLASLATTAVAELSKRQSACPAINTNFYLVAKLLGALNGTYGAIDPRGPYPIFSSNTSRAVPYFLDSDSHLHATTEPTNYQLWVSLNYDRSGDPETADEFQYISVYKPYKGMSPVTCELAPTDSGGCELHCRKRIFVTALNGYLTLRQPYVCPTSLALGTSTPNAQYRCKKVTLLVQAIGD